MKDDSISRQAAIDLICKHGVDLERRGILVLALVEHKQMTIDLLESLPSAQPEILRCKDCKHYRTGACAISGLIGLHVDDFCSRAERRENQ